MPSENRTGDIQLHKARKYMLEKQLDEMKNRITGRNNSFYPYIADRTGKVSERKLARFIKELLDGAQKYGRQHTLLEIKGELRELCECFLYCAIQGIGIYNEGEKYAERSACFFSDLTDIAKHKNNLFLMDEKMKTLSIVMNLPRRNTICKAANADITASSTRAAFSEAAIWRICF